MALVVAAALILALSSCAGGGCLGPLGADDMRSVGWAMHMRDCDGR